MFERYAEHLGVAVMDRTAIEAPPLPWTSLGAPEVTMRGLPDWDDGRSGQLADDEWECPASYRCQVPHGPCCPWCETSE